MNACYYSKVVTPDNNWAMSKIKPPTWKQLKIWPKKQSHQQSQLSYLQAFAYIMLFETICWHSILQLLSELISYKLLLELISFTATPGANHLHSYS